MRRIVEPEEIDDPSTPIEELEYLLKCVRATNLRLGGVSIVLERLKAWSLHWPRDRAVSLLDVATGSGDVPLAAVRWAHDAGFDLRVTGIDTSERVLDVARDVCRAEPAIDFIRADARDLLDPARSPLAPRSYDYVHAGMFLHHLDDATVPRMLMAMNRIARAGLIWNDLIRTYRGYAVAWVATLGRAIRHDCLASLRAGFTRTEVLAHAREAGLDYASYQEYYMYQRFTFAGEKPQGWIETKPGSGVQSASLPTIAAGV